MSEKISKWILIGELIVIAFPLLVILSFATLTKTSDLFSSVENGYSFFWGNFVIVVIALLAWVALFSGYTISRTFIKQGVGELRKLKSYWWALAFLGLIIQILAWVSALLPPSPEYSLMAVFRFEFNAFVWSSPLTIPFAHLILERLFRKETTNL